MTDRLRIALAQINPVVGDIGGNLGRIRAARKLAADAKADLLLLPELCLSGYPPEDLVLKPFFLDRLADAVALLAAETADGGPDVLLTTPRARQEGPLPGTGQRAYNAVLHLAQGRIRAERYKVKLPNYGVFDEMRVFVPGPMPGPIEIRGVPVGVPICEDIWSEDVVECLQESGAEILLVPNGSPFEDGKDDTRLAHAIARVVESGLPLVYLNQIGGQDELVFDGGSFVLNADRSLAHRLHAFAEDMRITDWTRTASGWVCEAGETIAPPDRLEAIWKAMVLGLGDYVNKNGFPGVILGLSGGIDSAISAACAVDALGAERVRCLMMPSPYTSTESLEDAEACARLLGVRLDAVSIEPAMQAFQTMAGPLFEGRPADITEENIQSRARGVTLMALSNKLGHMVLTTGNKSEMSTGYATLYGDMCGGYSVLKDIYKTDVFALSRWRNANCPAGMQGPKGAVMPERVISKPPSAELRPDQKDEDSLPPYDVLDAILRIT